MDQPDKARAVTREVFQLMQRRIALLIALPVASLDRLSLQSQTREIAERTRATGTNA